MPGEKEQVVPGAETCVPAGGPVIGTENSEAGKRLFEHAGAKVVVEEAAFPATGLSDVLFLFRNHFFLPLLFLVSRYQQIRVFESNRYGVVGGIMPW